MRARIALGLASAALLGLLSGCNDADIASRNLSQAADNFEINRRIVFYNGITDTYMVTIEGMCSLGNTDGPREVTVTFKTGTSQYKKHKLGISDNVTYFMQQIDAADVSAYHYRVIFKPQAILPDIDFRGDGGEVLKNRN